MLQLLSQLMKRVSTGNMNLRFQYVTVLLYSFMFFLNHLDLLGVGK